MAENFDKQLTGLVLLYTNFYIYLSGFFNVKILQSKDSASANERSSEDTAGNANVNFYW